MSLYSGAPVQSVSCTLIYPDLDEHVDGELYVCLPHPDECLLCCEPIGFVPAIVADMGPGGAVPTEGAIHLTCAVQACDAGQLTLIVGEAERLDTGRHHERVA